MMNKKLNKYSGFTLIETLTALVIIATITVFTVCATINSDETKLKQLRAITKSFYMDVQNAYQAVLASDVKGMNIERLNSNEISIKEDSAQLADMLGAYMDAYVADCKMFPDLIKKNYSKELPNMTCANSPRGVSMGIYLNRNCNITFKNNLEYMGDTIDQTAKTRTVYNCCGYIMYAPKRSQGIRGKDFFLIPLGKRGIL